ncbi:MAG TPA: lytic transglycosylase domain-containing protein [Saprospiraceae bacterium]|nr:lytic transglycosylase domain-containing protein [Saprospiraceae bacterium]
MGSFFDLPQQIKAVNLDKKFDFAGEIVPINDDTKERLDRELSVNAYWQSTTLLNIKMSHKYFPIVERILKEQGVPDDFKYLAIAESGLRNVTSSASAKGFWQFMKPAALEMGLEISEEVDERLHLEKSTLAACNYIKQMYKRFGTWTNVAGAYNVGPTSFARSLAEQKETSYYDLNINEETSRYLFRIIAIKEIVKNPSDFGYYLEDDHKYQPQNLKEIKVSNSITSLTDFAHENGLTYRMLKYYNPWLISSKLTVAQGKEYTIKVPKA